MFTHGDGSKMPKISISGAAETGHCGAGAMQTAKELGREIAKQGAVIVTGATTGFPLWAAIGAREEGATSIGFSPAASEYEHIHGYRLPMEHFDLLVYTGFGYSGRDLILTRSADAVIFGCGRIGTIHEFTVAFEDRKPIGILRGPWEMDETLEGIIKHGHRKNPFIVFDKDPRSLVSQVLRLVKKNKELGSSRHSYRSPEV